MEMSLAQLVKSITESARMGRIFEMTNWYQCSACGNRVDCAIRLDKKKMKEIKEAGDCPSYDYKPTLRLRSTFR